MSFFRTLKKIFSLETFGKLLGSNLIATVFFIGYLPEWSRHWSAFLSVIISLIIVYNVSEEQFNEIDISYILLLEFIYIYLLANLMVPIFRKVYKFSKTENITIDAFLAQILVLGMCVPAIFYINKGVILFMSNVCRSFLNCSSFVFEFLVLFVTLIVPYFILRFFDILEFWPTNQMFLYAELSFNRIIAGIIPALYAIIFIYLASFLFFDLTLVKVIDFYSIVFKKIYLHSIFVFFIINKVFNWKAFYVFMKKIGVISFLDKLGLINIKHYDIKYLS